MAPAAYAELEAVRGPLTRNELALERSPQSSRDHRMSLAFLRPFFANFAVKSLPSPNQTALFSNPWLPFALIGAKISVEVFCDFPP